MIAAGSTMVSPILLSVQGQTHPAKFRSSCFRNCPPFMPSFHAAVFDITEVDGSKVENPRKLQALTQARVSL